MRLTRAFQQCTAIIDIRDMKETFVPINHVTRFNLDRLLDSRDLIDLIAERRGKGNGRTILIKDGNGFGKL